MPPIDAAALAGHDPTAPVVALAGETMGTTWRVTYAGRQPAFEVHAAIEVRLASLVAQLSHWQAGSALSRFNDAPAGTWMRLPPDLARAVGEALRIAEATDGAFDPAIGALVDLWGFGPPGPRPTPSDAQVAAARARSGWRRLAWRPADRLLHQPGGVRLDLSGIAKGHAVDALADLLARRDLRHCLVEIGGELVGRGLHPDGDPWWVDLEEPPASTLRPIRVALHGLAVATSGTYRKGEHNIDPRTGRPPTNGVVSVSVLAASAMLADALASAVFVAHPGPPGTSATGTAARIVTTTADGVVEALTPGFADLLND